MKSSSPQFPFFNEFAPLKPLLHKADGFFFDLDGTLVDNEGQALDQIRDVISEAIREVSEGTHQGLRACFRHLAGHKIDEIIEIAEQQSQVFFPHGRRETIKEEIKRRRKSTYENLVTAKVIDPLVAFAHFVQKEGIPACIVTASERDRALAFIAAAGIDKIFTTPPKDWLFASNLQAKTHTHHQAQLHLERVHNIQIDRTRWIGFEDSPSATEQGILAGAVVIPHMLCTHITGKHRETRARVLRDTKCSVLMDRAAKNGHSEFALAADLTVRPIAKSTDVEIISTPSDLIPVIWHTLQALPERNVNTAGVAPRALRIV